MVNILKGISLNGVDERTDLEKLSELQKKYPFLEFGIILSKNFAENGNRYINPALLKNFSGLGLNLSAHLCGSVAREAIRDNWQPAVELCGGYFNIFQRTQLNVAPYGNNPETLEFCNIPENIKEVIIQQKPTNVSLFKEYHERTNDSRVVVLLDGSGGTGIKGDFHALSGFGKCGYAGGINESNLKEATLSVLSGESDAHEFWMDAESGVRTDDWFDLEKADKMADIIRQII